MWLMQNHWTIKRICKSHVLEACSLMFGAICDIWGVSPKPRFPGPCDYLVVQGVQYDRYVCVCV